MTSAASATEAAAYEALAAGVTLAQVFQHVPPETDPPLVVIGEIEGQAFGTKGADRDRRILLTIGYQIEGEARKPLLDIREEVETALDGVTIARDGWRLGFAYLDDGDARDEENQELYAGVSRFTVIALED